MNSKENLFESLNGREIEIPNDPGLRRFVADTYAVEGRSRLALEVQTGEGKRTWWEPDMVVTVNLPELELPEGCFFVRRHGYERALDNLLATGLFEDLGVDVPAGYVEKYARVWRLKLSGSIGPNAAA